MHLSQSGSRSDKRLEGRGIETRDAQRTLWSHSHGTVAQCTRKHTASESHKVPLQHGWTKPKLRTRTRASLDKTTPEEGGSPRPRAFLLSERDPLCRRGSRVNFMKLTLLPRRQSGSRSDKRKARGRGLPPSSGVVLSNEARVRVRSFGFVQPCCSGTLWLSDAVCLRVHCATVPWEWLHKVLCASRVSIPRPSNLLSERDPLCDKCISAEAELTS